MPSATASKGELIAGLRHCLAMGEDSDWPMIRELLQNTETTCTALDEHRLPVSGTSPRCGNAHGKLNPERFYPGIGFARSMRDGSSRVIVTKSGRIVTQRKYYARGKAQGQYVRIPGERQ